VSLIQDDIEEIHLRERIEERIYSLIVYDEQVISALANLDGFCECSSTLGSPVDDTALKLLVVEELFDLAVPVVSQGRRAHYQTHGFEFSFLID
jgi:hypothetical protein